MTLKEYLTNPLGKGDSSLPGWKMIVQNMNAKYMAWEKKKGDQIKVTTYYDNRSGDVYFHLVLPTETERDNTYDVVIRFLDIENKHKHDMGISDYDVQLFANTPSFVYTHAYVYHEYGIGIDFLDPKLGKPATREAPTVRNKFEIIGYDKYIYFAAKWLYDGRKLGKLSVQRNSVRFNQKKLYASVRTIKTIMEEYHAAEAKLKREKNYQKDQAKRAAERPKKLSLDSGTPIGIGKRVVKKTGVDNRVKPKRAVKPVKKR